MYMNLKCIFVVDVPVHKPTNRSAYSAKREVPMIELIMLWAPDMRCRIAF